jgi:hypothetical protein
VRGKSSGRRAGPMRTLSLPTRTRTRLTKRLARSTARPFAHARTGHRPHRRGTHRPFGTTQRLADRRKHNRQPSGSRGGVPKRDLAAARRAYVEAIAGGAKSAAAFTAARKAFRAHNLELSGAASATPCGALSGATLTTRYRIPPAARIWWRSRPPRSTQKGEKSSRHPLSETG